MATLMTALLLILATVRVTRAVVMDKITEPLREWVITKNGADGWWTYLFHCGWCFGFWVALPAAVITWWPAGAGTFLTVDWWFGIPALWFAYAYATGWILTKEND